MMQQSSLNSTMNRSLSCMQINLRHSWSASASLAQLLLDRIIDIDSPSTKTVCQSKPNFISEKNMFTGCKLFFRFSQLRKTKEKSLETRNHNAKCSSRVFMLSFVIHYNRENCNENHFTSLVPLS